MSDIQEININEIKIHPLLEEMRKDPKAGNSINQYFISYDKTKIFFRTWKPKGEVKKIILFNHGMSGHGEYFVLLADRLVEQGVMMVVPDYRNHGYSEGKKGDLKKFKHILKDLHFFFNYLKETYPNIPIFLGGESMGGAVSVNFARYYPEDFNKFSGMLLFAPAVKTNFPKIFWIAIGVISPLAGIVRILIPSVRFISMRGREEDGSTNSLHQRYDREDPVHADKASLRYLLQVFKHIRKCKKIAPLIEIPTIIFQGTRDKVISPEGVRSFYNFLSSKDRKVVLVEGGYHSFISDQEFINYWKELKDWMEKH